MEAGLEKLLQTMTRVQPNQRPSLPHVRDELKRLTLLCSVSPTKSKIAPQSCQTRLIVCPSPNPEGYKCCPGGVRPALCPPKVEGNLLIPTQVKVAQSPPKVEGNPTTTISTRKTHLNPPPITTTTTTTINKRYKCRSQMRKAAIVATAAICQRERLLPVRSRVRKCR